ncbi:MAG: DegT/DnrJ/EryC1/StrS family aminotransferase [Pseudomonadota bacterium]
MRVPFVDLKAQYASIQTEIDSAISEVIAETAFIGGRRIDAFEAVFAEAIGAEHCIGVGNGTDAIYIVLKMLGLGPGDEVITVANSWISTSETITQTGARPVFVDIDPHYNIDVSQIEAKITKKTKAIVPVHLYGQPADMGPLMAIAEKYGLLVVEDCAQAHLASYDGKNVGTIGNAGTFSFYPGKNLGAYGDAGGIVTSDAALAEKCKRFARHGALKKHEHTVEGINSRLDGIQAAILHAKLPHLHEWTEQRQQRARRYTDLLSGVSGVTTPDLASNRSHVFHLYVIRCDRRDELREYLSQHGVSTGIHYPTPLPLLPAYDYLGHSESDFPRASEWRSKILSLPMYPELADQNIEYVVGHIEQFLSS